MENLMISMAALYINWTFFFFFLSRGCVYNSTGAGKDGLLFSVFLLSGYYQDKLNESIWPNGEGGKGRSFVQRSLQGAS